MNAFWWAIVTALIWGIVPILEKVGLSRVDPFTALFFRCLGVVLGVIMLSFFIVKPQAIRSVDAKTVVLLVLSGFLASFVAQITFYHGLKIGDVSKVVPISGSYYLVAFVLGLILFKEVVTAQKIVGMVLVAVGVWFLR